MIDIPRGTWIAAAEWLPATSRTPQDALLLGQVTAEEIAAMGYSYLPCSEDLSAPQMAAEAGLAALERAQVDPARLGSVHHAWTYYQGHDFWSPAHYVAARLGARHAVPVGIQQMCNGGAAALEAAVARLAVTAPPACALVTTADRFVAPGFDRWAGDYGVWYGDGATAAVLGRAVTPGTVPPERSLQLRALVTRAQPDLEVVHRGRDRFHAAAGELGPVDVRRTKKAYLSGTSRDAFVARLRRCTTEVLAAALAQAADRPGACTDSGPRSVLLPRLGAATARDIYGKAVAEVTGAPAVDLGAGTGHLGAGDALSNLAALSDPSHPQGLLPGEYAVVLSAGAGFTWSALVVQRPTEQTDPS
ncbi:3-oxoacyl-ACP synthase [Streptomyces sp. NBC_00006]|uniref:3-oxoacyl-ACP synthase n=1 Tax=Streptomyces sp. NBC_00006 TaxID=2975619 RepID=UPI002256F344|nr:3-oxoacyl-ACP synthase [Streptomyces sp. NBC_00006]MCX5529211.1 3-oxoacyl-ACP synthase [Streptomyces sp. NBC_00006]